MRQHPIETKAEIKDYLISVKEYLITQRKVKDVLIRYNIGEYELQILEYLSINCEERIITAREVHSELNLDRGWAYRSLRKLETLDYISRTGGGWIHISGMVKVVLRRVEECIGRTRTLGY